jgi:hypothetical protein
MIVETEISSEIDAEFWRQVQFWIRECEEFERKQADAVNSPETVELIRRTVAKLEDYERRRAAFDESPEGIAEFNRIIAKFVRRTPPTLEKASERCGKGVEKVRD